MSELFYNVGYDVYSWVTVDGKEDEEAFSTPVYLYEQEVISFIKKLDTAFNNCPNNIKRKATQKSEIVEEIEYNECKKMLNKFFKNGSDPRKEAEKYLQISAVKNINFLFTPQNLPNKYYNCTP